MSFELAQHSPWTLARPSAARMLAPVHRILGTPMQRPIGVAPRRLRVVHHGRLRRCTAPTVAWLTPSSRGRHTYCLGCTSLTGLRRVHVMKTSVGVFAI